MCQQNFKILNQITRYKDGIKIEKSENIQIDVKNKVIHTLSIKAANPNDFGKYTIKAKNEIGEAECSTNICVDGIKIKIFLTLNYNF